MDVRTEDVARASVVRMKEMVTVDMRGMEDACIFLMYRAVLCVCTRTDLPYRGGCHRASHGADVKDKAKRNEIGHYFLAYAASAYL